MMAKIEWYEEILALEPGSKVFFPFAKRLAEDGLHDKALAVLRHGLVQHPEYLEARVFLTHLLFSIGNTESAMAEAQLVFGRLAPFPAFWEALSLAHEAMPGDMSLAMRFMAEALRTPGLTVAATMRRGLLPQIPQVQQVTQVLEPAPALLFSTEQPPVAESMTSAESMEAAPPVEEVPAVELLPDAEPGLLSIEEPDSVLPSEPESIPEAEPEPMPLAEPESGESTASALLSSEELELLAPAESVTSAPETDSQKFDLCGAASETMSENNSEHPEASLPEHFLEAGPLAESLEMPAESVASSESLNSLAPFGSLDPLAPVTDEEDSPVAESACSGPIYAEALLPLDLDDDDDDDDDDDVPLLPDVPVESAAEPAVAVPVDNAETMLADAASVDEALAELHGVLDNMAAEAAEPEFSAQADDTGVETVTTDDSLAPDETVVVSPASEELPQLSVEDLNELDKTVFGEVTETAKSDEAVAAGGLEADLTDFSELPSLEELAELADLADENPLLSEAAEADNSLPVDIEPKFTLDVVSEEGESVSPAVDTPATEGAEPVAAPSFYLDGGLLDLDLDGALEADITEPVETESADIAAESAVPEPEQGSGEAGEDAFALAEDALEPVEEALESEDEAVAAIEVAAFAEDVQEPVDMTLDTEDVPLPPAEAVQEVEHEPLEFTADQLPPAQPAVASGEDAGLGEDPLDLDEPLDLSPEALALMQSALGIGDEPAQKSAELEQEAGALAQDPVELVEKIEAPELPSAVRVQIQPANMPAEVDEPVLELTDTAAEVEDSSESEDVVENEGSDGDMTDDAPLRTRSMADVLAEQGDIDGALAIYEDLLHRASPDEAASLGKHIEALRSQKTAEKQDPKASSKSDKAGLRSMLENLAGRLEKRAKS